jgi:hypothetical protein
MEANFGFAIIPLNIQSYITLSISATKLIAAVLRFFEKSCVWGLRQTQRSASSKSSTGAGAKKLNRFFKHFILKAV